MRIFQIIFCLLLMPTAFMVGQTIMLDDQHDVGYYGLEDYGELFATAAIQDLPANISSGITSSYSGEVIRDSSRFAAQEMMPVSVEPAGFVERNRTALTIGGSLAITATLFATDQATYNTLYAWKMSHPLLNRTSPVITNLGDGKSSIVLFGGAYAYSLLMGDARSKEIGLVGLESFAVSGVASLVLKMSFSREQPNVATRSGGTFYGPFAFFRQSQNSGKGWSFFDAFPSGHTATVFAAATTIADLCSSPWISAASYSVASMVGVSRIMEQTHWASDVFVGSIVGYYSTKLVEKLNNNPQDFSVAPAVGSKSLGMMLSVKL